jgi:urocanate hydratase
MGVLRHADAGYREATEFAAAHGPRVPHLTARTEPESGPPGS